MSHPWDPDRQERADLWATLRQVGADLASLARQVRALAGRITALEQRDRDDT